MRKIPLKKSLIITALLFTVSAVIVACGVYFLNTETVYIGDEGDVMSRQETVGLSLVFSFIGFGYLYLAVYLWHRILFNRSAMTLTDEGVCDSFVIFGVLAFWTAIPVKFIPWKAFDGYKEGTSLHKINTDLIPKEKLGAIPRFVLHLMGFNSKIGAECIPSFHSTEK